MKTRFRPDGSAITPARMCPCCGYATDSASTLDGARGRAPSPGDFSLCLRCSAILVYGPDLGLLRAPDAALAELAREQPDDHRLLLRARAANLVRQAVDPIPDRGGRA